MNKGNEGAKGNYMDEALHNGQQTVTAEEYDRNRQDWPGALTCVGRCGARVGLTHWTPSGGGDVPGIPKFRLLAKENHAPGCPYGTVLSRDVSRRGSHRASPPPAISPAVIRVRIQVAAQADAPSGDAGDRREGDEKRPARRLRVRRWGQMQPHEDRVCPLAARDRAIRVSGEPGPRLSFRRSGYRQLIIAPWRSFFYVSPVDDGRCYDYLSNWQATQEAARQAARLERPIHPLCIEGYVRDRKDLGDGRFRVRLHAPLVEPHDRPRAGVVIRPRIAAWGRFVRLYFDRRAPEGVRDQPCVELVAHDRAIFDTLPEGAHVAVCALYRALEEQTQAPFWGKRATPYRSRTVRDEVFYPTQICQL